MKLWENSKKLWKHGTCFLLFRYGRTSNITRIPKCQISYPFMYLNFWNPFSFCIYMYNVPGAWKMNPNQSEPPCIGQYPPALSLALAGSYSVMIGYLHVYVHVWYYCWNILNLFKHFRGSSPYSWAGESLSLDIDRENVLGSAMNQMGRTLGHALRNRSLHVTFKNEPGNS